MIFEKVNIWKGNEQMMENKIVFENIIGYDEIKLTLKRVIDILNNEDKYKELGCQIPNGLLLYGEPGIGKSTIANELKNSVSRKTFVIRKSKSDGDFINYIGSIFKKAVDNQPALIILDDLDKFAESKKYNAEEYVVVQTKMDEIKEKDVFVLATANNIKNFPESLLRSGRFDIKIHLERPNEKDSLKIIKHYLKNKKLSSDVNTTNIAHILNGVSCADLEKVCNQAGIYAGYNGKKSIGMNELVRASLEQKYNTSIETLDKEDKYSLNIAYHEAGHALVYELLEPGAVSFITITKNNSDARGMTILHNDENYFDDIKFMKNRIKALLAGKASTELFNGKCDTGATDDLHRAFDVARRFIDGYCINGFNSWIASSVETSEKVKQSKDDEVNKLMTNYYNEVKGLLIQNRHILDTLATELNKKKILFKDEIESICKNQDKYKG